LCQSQADSNRSRWAAGVLWALAAVVFPGGVEAQPVVPTPGEEVRVVQRGIRGAVHGRFREATQDAVVLSDLEAGRPIQILRSDITGMSVQRGFRTRAFSGAVTGLGVGLVGGIVAGQTTEVFESTGVAVAAGSAGGLVLGMLIGFLIQSPDWDGIDMGALTVRPSIDWGPRYQP